MLSKPAAFFASIHTTICQGRNFTQPQVDGFNTILDYIDKVNGTPISMAAYILATTYHETGAAMQPVREDGEGRGKPYGKPAGPWEQVYYGRGYVQLTWYSNYLRANKQLLGRAGLDPFVDDLTQRPDLALRPDVAAAILVEGMLAGWFTGAPLDRYISSTHTDFINARRVVNGTDCAAKIAVYAEHFLDALRQGQWGPIPKSPEPVS